MLHIPFAVPQVTAWLVPFCTDVGACLSSTDLFCRFSLQNNNFEGELPPLSLFTNLRILRANQNKFNSTIPSVLSTPWLTNLVVAQNK
jgi:hypothetical protein